MSIGIMLRKWSSRGRWEGRWNGSRAKRWWWNGFCCEGACTDGPDGETVRGGSVCLL